jgi:hypothetical protein
MITTTLYYLAWTDDGWQAVQPCRSAAGANALAKWLESDGAIVTAWTETRARSISFLLDCHW